MNLEEYTSSTRKIVDAAVELYQRIVDPKLLVRRISLVANHVIQECELQRRTRMNRWIFLQIIKRRKNKSSGKRRT